jgi:hypothetical protein
MTVSDRDKDITMTVRVTMRVTVRVTYFRYRQQCCGSVNVSFGSGYADRNPNLQVRIQEAN